MTDPVTVKPYTAATAAWRRFLWVLWWGAVATGVAFLGEHLVELAGPLATQAYWPVVVPTLTAVLAALKKYADERVKGF
jgi:hypothetical protein